MPPAMPQKVPSQALANTGNLSRQRRNRLGEPRHDRRYSHHVLKMLGSNGIQQREPFWMQKQARKRL